MTARWARHTATGLAALTLALPLGACRSLPEESGSDYQPAALGEADADGIKPVTFTADAARRVSLKTAPVLARGSALVVPYAALIYDKKGASWVYAESPALTYRRVKVVVVQVVDDEAVLSKGPKPGARVVTMGATEVYGTELEIASKH